MSTSSALQQRTMRCGPPKMGPAEDGRSLTSTSVPPYFTFEAIWVSKLATETSGSSASKSATGQPQLHMHHLQDLLLERRKLNRCRSVSLLQEMLQGSKAFLRIPIQWQQNTWHIAPMSRRKSCSMRVRWSESPMTRGLRGHHSRGHLCSSWVWWMFLRSSRASDLYPMLAKVIHRGSQKYFHRQVQQVAMIWNWNWDRKPPKPNPVIYPMQVAIYIPCTISIYIYIMGILGNLEIHVISCIITCS